MNLKKLFHPKYLPHFALACGALCALVRWPWYLLKYHCSFYNRNEPEA